MGRHLLGIPRDGLFPKKKHTLESKRATRGHHGHEWDVDASRGSTQTWWVQPETWADAEVEVVDERDKNKGRAATNDAVSSKTAIATGNSAGDAATEKEGDAAIGGLHRLQNSRNGSLNANYMENTDANDKACDLNPKFIQASDALAKEYVDFVATRANEHEARNVLHATTLEVAEKLEL